MARRTYERLAWEDRFNRPDTDALREGLHGQPRKIFDALRKYLLQIEGVQEFPVWYGESWRWSIEFRLPGLGSRSGRNGKRTADIQTESPNDLIAVLIPSPEDLQLAMQVEPTLAGSLPTRALKRAVRDGLDLAAEPFDTRWGVWSVQQPNLAEDLKNLIKRKAEHLLRSAGD